MRAINILTLFLAFFLFSFFLNSCGDNGDGDAPDGEDNDSGKDDDTTDNDDDDNIDDDDDPTLECDATKNPIVFVHGMVDAGDTFANSAMRFASNGYCLDRVFAFDWNTVDLNYSAQAAGLAIYINNVLGITGAEQIELVGHSAGGLLSRIYLKTPGNAANVAHYANLASFGGSAPAGVPSINISSEYDAVVGSSYLEGAINVLLLGTDHLQVVSCAESFDELYRFFNEDEAPETTAIVPEKIIALSGRIVSLDENKIGAGFTVKIYEYDPATGQRITKTPLAEFTGDEGGYFGPFEGSSDAYYEYWVIPADPSEVSVHYYREPQPRSNSLIYLRTLPDSLSLFGLLFKVLLVIDDASTMAASFTANQSTVAGRDTLFVDGYEISTQQIASVSQSTIAVFFADVDRNGQSDKAPLNGLLGLIVGAFPLLQSFDLLIPATPDRIIPFTFNGRTINVPNLMSESQGVVIPVFD